ncbi:MAG: hypothetical protein U5L96_09265 [Owenweeksia sp.]|nr:hypothetical protein [Owenweeksia sp.]
MKKLFFSFILITLTSCFCYSQNGEESITYIAFHFEHSMRIPHHEVSVEITKGLRNLHVYVKSTPMNDDPEWAKSKIDTAFSIDSTGFASLLGQVSEVKNIDLKKAVTRGFDGTRWSIEYGTYTLKTKYTFWTPDYKTEERELAKFVNLCYRIIEIGQLDQNIIL